MEPTTINLVPLERETRSAIPINEAARHLNRAAQSLLPSGFVPLSEEKRTHVPTNVMCHHLGRKPQTARIWACTETYPPGLKPTRVLGRLMWPVAGIRALLDSEAPCQHRN